MIDTTQYPSVQQVLDYAETGMEVYRWSKQGMATLAAELRSLLTSNEVNAKLAVEWEVKHHALRTQIAEMGREMASVVAERDALKAQQPKPQKRKLREVKGVTYQDGRWWYNDFDYRTVSSLIARRNVTFTDADHAAIYALRADPYEPVETVDEVLRAFVDAALNHYHKVMRGDNSGAPQTREYATRLRAAFQHELAGGGQ